MQFYRLECFLQTSYEDWNKVQTMLEELHSEQEQQLLEVEKQLKMSEMER